MICKNCKTLPCLCTSKTDKKLLKIAKTLQNISEKEDITISLTVSRFEDANTRVFVLNSHESSTSIYEGINNNIQIKREG